MYNARMLLYINSINFYIIGLFLQIFGVCGRDESRRGSGPLVRAKGWTGWRARACTTCPVSSLIGSPNHSKKLPVLILFISVGCFMNCISI